MNTTDNEPKVELPELPFTSTGAKIEADYIAKLERERNGLQRAYDKALAQMNQAISKAEWYRTSAIVDLEKENAELRRVIETTRTQLESALDDLVRAYGSRLPKA